MDKFDSVIKKNILKINNVPPMPRSNQSGYIDFQISFDMFGKFLRERRLIPCNMPICCKVYDETIIKNDEDIKLRYEFLKRICNIKFANIEFILSDCTMPVYNEIMDNINWRQDDVTFLKMPIDREPTNVKDLKLNHARGKVLLPEEKLLWLSDYELIRSKGKIDRKVIEDTDKLKYVVRDFIDKMDRQYDLSKMSTYDKVCLTYHYITDRDKLNIAFASEGAIVGTDGLQHVNRNIDWQSKPYETYVRRRGICEGQARLFRVLLNNWYFEIDAITIDGRCPLGPHTWVGVVIQDKLYYCCTAQKKLFSKTNFVSNLDEIYPQIYPISSLSDESIKNIERHVRSLKR